jgi:hypothetical protein
MIAIAKSWLFGSKSNPKATPHETLQYVDGSTSCNCSGWTKRVADDGSRSCRHTRLVDMGRADAECISYHDYVEHQTAQNAGVEIPKAKKPAKVKDTPPAMVVRKIKW